MQDASRAGAGKSGPNVQDVVNTVSEGQGVNTLGTVTVGVTLTQSEVAALAMLCAATARAAEVDGAVLDGYREFMREAAAVLLRVLDDADRVRGDECERCYHERARIVRTLHEQLLDESTLSTPGGATDAFSQVRDAGYRAGWNDRARSLVKELQS